MVVKGALGVVGFQVRVALEIQCQDVHENKAR